MCAAEAGHAACVLRVPSVPQGLQIARGSDTTNAIPAIAISYAMLLCMPEVDRGVGVYLHNDDATRGKSKCDRGQWRIKRYACVAAVAVQIHVHTLLEGLCLQIGSGGSSRVLIRY